MTERLALVERSLASSLPPGTATPGRIRVTQEGEMRLKPGGRWLGFSAVEELYVRETAFSWQARFTLARLLPVRVVDGYAGGEGRMEARLLGLVPVLRARGQAVSEGEVYRYLAELPWVPYAMRANPELGWSEVDERTVEVTAHVGPAPVAVRLAFDGAGDVVRSWADLRPRTEGKTVCRRPWGGVFADHAELGGVRIPTRAEVAWELPDGPFPYWRGTITSLELCD